MKGKIKKVVVIGPESTGKSTLSELIAKHFNTEWCAEYAREYLLTNGTDYSYNDLLTIAKGQLALENKALQTVENNGGDLLIIDTDMYVMQVWCEYVFGKCHDFIKQQIAEREYDLYLLCNIDQPWVKDELREYPDEGPRIELYDIYKTILQNQAIQWVDINGNYEERLRKAIEAVSGF